MIKTLFYGIYIKRYQWTYGMGAICNKGSKNVEINLLKKTQFGGLSFVRLIHFFLINHSEILG